MPAPVRVRSRGPLLLAGELRQRRFQRGAPDNQRKWHVVLRAGNFQATASGLQNAKSTAQWSLRQMDLSTNPVSAVFPSHTK
jgi:hypothetical protein